MNIILSLLVSIAMLFSGTGTLPAVPETATAYTLSEVTLSLNGESVTLNPSLQLTAALGAEEIALALDVFNGGESQLPVAGKLDTEGVSFSISDTGKAFSMSYEELEALAGFEMDAETEEALNMVKEFIQLLPQMYNTEEAQKVSGLMIQDWITRSGAAVESTTVELDGEAKPASHVVMNLSMEDLISSMDVLADCESEAYRSYYALYLKLMSLAMGTEYESFSALTAALVEEEGASEIVLPLEITTADDGSYMLVSIEMEMDGVTFVTSAAVILEEGSMTEDVIMVVSEKYGEESAMDMSVMFNIYADEAGNANFAMSVASADEYRYEETEEDGSSYAWGGGEVMLLNANADVAVDENGLAETYAIMDMELTEASFDESYGEEYESTVTVSASLQSSEEAGEDGSVTTDYAVSFAAGEDGEEAMNFDLAFKLNRAELPYADPFEGKEIVALPADTENDAYAQLEAELMAPLGGLMMLSSDESVMQLVELFTAQEDYASYDVEYDVDSEVMVGVDSDGGTYATIEEAAAAFGMEVPAYTAPEGYELEYIYADEGYMSLDYSSEDSYFSISIMEDYFADSEKTLFLQADGSFLEAEGYPVQLSLEEDGSVSYAVVKLDGMEVDFYFDSVDIAAAEAILAGLIG